MLSGSQRSSARRHSREGGNPDLPDGSLCRGAVRAGWHGLGRTSTTLAGRRFTGRPCSTMWLVSRLRGSDVLSCVRTRLLGLRLCSGPATERAPQPRSPTAHAARRHSREGGNPDPLDSSLCRGAVRAGWHGLERTSTTSAARRFTRRPCSTMWLVSRLRGSSVNRVRASGDPGCGASRGHESASRRGRLSRGGCACRSRVRPSRRCAAQPESSG